MENNEKLDKKTQEIDRLINKTNSGKNAWRAGGLLIEIKQDEEFKANNYSSFGAYTTNALRISETKANNYIKIYRIYSENEISDLVLLTHLLEIADKDQDIREKILEYARKVDKRKIDKNNSIQISTNSLQSTAAVTRTEKVEMRPDYNTEILSIAANLLDTAKSKQIQITDKLTQLAFECSTDIQERKKVLESNKLPNRIGQLLTSNFYPEILSLFPYQPTNEMGLVALFCVLFYKLKGKAIKFGNNTLLFNYIEYVRSEFPDCKVSFINPKNNYQTSLRIEFEFISESFIAHQHLKNEEKCDIIICWINNLDSNRLKAFGFNFPPILAVKDILDYDNFELR